jgi:hypothetical protein
VQALTTDQVVALTTSQVAGLSTTAIKALTTTQFRALETTDLVALNTAQIVVLSTSQAAALSTFQVQALNTNQIAALNTAAYAALDTSTPIILDLNGDGVKTLGISSGVKFDIFADGAAINTGWVSSSDGLLVMDRDHDGQINDGSELFGSSTQLSNGARAPDGYAALRELDSNHDGAISADDAAYADLRVWVDSNSDGVTETGELKTLASLGISQISTNTSVGTGTDNGNILGLTSTYETTDGVTHAAADVWFIADKGGANASAGTLDAAIAALNPSTTPANASSADVSTSTIPSLVALAPIETAPESVGTKDDLRSRVSSLAQAIGSFGDAGVSTDGLVTPQLNATGTTNSTSTPTSLAVVSMADVMKQFDANGNSLGSPVSAAASTTTTLKLTGTQDTVASGVLAVKGTT